MNISLIILISVLSNVIGLFFGYRMGSNIYKQNAIYSKPKRHITDRVKDCLVYYQEYELAIEYREWVDKNAADTPAPSSEFEQLDGTPFTKEVSE